MSVRNVKIRFNLDKENDRRAYDYLQGAEKSYSKAVISAICGFMELSERTATEDAFLLSTCVTKKKAEGDCTPYPLLCLLRFIQSPILISFYD